MNVYININIVIVLLVSYCNIALGTYVVSWGSNNYGQLGDGTTVTTSTPVVVTDYATVDVASIRVGLSTHFAMLADGTVYAGGNNAFGQLGINSVNNIQNRPVRNTLAYGVDVFPNGPHTIAFNGTTKDVLGWGQDAGFVLGKTGVGKNQLIPARSAATFAFAGNVIALNHAWTATFVTTNGGTYVAGKVVTYGGYTSDTNAKLGIGASVDQGDFIRMSFWDNVPLQKLYSGSSSHICGVAKNMSLYCWGKNSLGQLGIGTTTDASVPKLVPFFDEQQLVIGQLQAGDTHTVALTCGGKVYTWGNNNFGNLGLGYKDASAHATPNLVGNLTSLGIIEIQSAMNTIFARSSSNDWYGWGAASSVNLLQLGITEALTPTYIPYFTTNNLTRIAVNSKATFAFAWRPTHAPTSISADCPVLRDECKLGLAKCAPSAICLDTERGYKCLCRSGFSGDGILIAAGGSGCTDIDECQTGGCVGSATCSNQIGNYVCTCPNGFKGDGKITGTGCTDIDECTEGGYCSPNTNCTNSVGSYVCKCLPGFRQIGTSPCGITCADIDECNTQQPCGSYSTCTNTAGGYTCGCVSGYTRVSSVCQDINECTTGGHNCALQSYCNNIGGSFFCKCPSGYIGDAVSTVNGGSGCQDINECADAPCHVNATCANSVGSYVCTCKSGFSGNGKNCTDINECASTSTNLCVTANGTCINTHGSYTCSCNSGFVGNGRRIASGGTGCIDVNECATGTDDCDPLATCVNTIGSYNCTCPANLAGSGKTCYSVNCSIGYYPNSTTTCSRCPTGTYNNIVGAEKCTPCPAGTFSTSIGATSQSVCRACSGYTYSGAGASICTQCLPGTFSGSGASTCTPCPAGQYGFQGTCMNCGLGWYSSEPGSTDCIPCPPGYFSNTTTATQCYQCPAGTISKGRAGVCTKCDAGTYSAAGEYYCTPCAPGSSTQGLTGASACTLCSAGTFASTPGSASCSQCARGTFAAQNGSDVCLGCLPGSYQNQPGQASCTLCSNWQFTDQYGATACGSCYQGYYAENEYGSKDCKSCPPGTFRDGSSTVCLPCYAGSASSYAAQAHCSYCMGGFHAKKCGQTQCDECVPGFFSSYGPTGQTDCTQCALGYSSFGTAYFCYKFEYFE